MRFLISFCIWVIIVGGMWVYTWHRDARLPQGPATAQAVDMVQGNFVLELTPTFFVEKDPFALDTAGKEALLTLVLNGQKIFIPDRPISRGKQVQIQGITGITAGTNEIFVKASPPLSQSAMDQALRIRLLDRGGVIVDRTIWSGGGSLVSGTVCFELEQGGRRENL